MADRPHAATMIVRIDQSRQGKVTVAPQVGNAAPVRASQLVNACPREDDVNVAKGRTLPRTGQGATCVNDVLQVR